MRASYQIPKRNWLILCFFSTIALVPACNKDNNPNPTPTKGDLEDIPYNPQAYTIVKPAHFPEIEVPKDNPMTLEGVQLGRRLFYDPILSADSSISCASCHLPKGSFTDNKATSKGIDGINGRRSAMSLLNVAYVKNGLFWDGRSPSLEDQALRPVEDPVEMHNSWTKVVEKLKWNKDYPTRFRQAFGINDRSEITKELAAKAMAQFERILISSGNSKYDRFKFKGENNLFDDEELDGFIMFNDDALNQGVNLPDAQCFHCHGGILNTGNNYFNNGLDSVSNLDGFKDLGRYLVTTNNSDKGKFRAPTLRNIELSAPYMHDGRFKTLEEVVDHYSKNGTGVSNEDPFIRQIGYPIQGSNPIKYTGLTPHQKQSIVKFLKTLTDTDFVNNPDIQNPFN
ncbi:MAG: cytochrome C peroxidase [Bacteroidetes bacterium]|nr:cytochrome C peroxidase [Bacteroidota bacterium]